MHGIYLALGSNLGDRAMNLITAIDLLMKHDVLVMGQSDVRETQALEGGGESYLNQVLEVQWGGMPEDLLRACKSVEAAMGRPVAVPMAGNVQFGMKKKEEHWAPRIIDIDILFFHDQVQKGAELILPHPGAWNRTFNVEAMADLGVKPNEIQSFLASKAPFVLEEGSGLKPRL